MGFHGLVMVVVIFEFMSRDMYCTLSIATTISGIQYSILKKPMEALSVNFRFFVCIEYIF